jgi:16S rRNA C967 or C1407 C5-methylase (RsmB/RsmF family)
METHFVHELKNVKLDDGRAPPPPSPLPWYPNNLGWCYTLSRNEIRKNRKHSELKDFHSFITTQTETGLVSRQEAVSMVPPFLLDVQPNHRVLDMCAAPGSKTCQIIEFLHRDVLQNPKALPTGLVVANDVDEKRCHTLVHQLKRLQSPCFLVTKGPAQQLPLLFLKEKGEGKEFFQYDRILCDVPSLEMERLAKTLMFG